MTHRDCIELEITRQIEIHRTVLQWAGLDWTGLEWTGMDWNGLLHLAPDGNTLQSTCVDGTSLEWTGLDCSEGHKTGLD